MANTNAPFGFRAVRRVDGAAPNFLANYRPIATDDSTAIGYGDPVTSLSTGYVTRATAGTTAIAGIFMGCQYYDSNQQKYVFMPQWSGTASTSEPAQAVICNDPNIVFEAQSNGSAITFADVMANINFVIGTPNSLTGISTSALDQSTINTALTTRPFKIVGISQRIGVDPASSYNVAEVVLNYTDLKNLAGV